MKTVKVTNPTTGKVIEVTEKTFTNVYQPAGFTIVEGGNDNDQAKAGANGAAGAETNKAGATGEPGAETGAGTNGGNKEPIAGITTTADNPAAASGTGDSDNTTAGLNVDRLDGQHMPGVTAEAAKVDQETNAARLTSEQYAANTQDRPAIMAALDALGVEYDSKARKDALLAIYDNAIAERGIDPE